VASNALSNLLRREADIAVRMVRPAQQSLVARKLGDMPIVAAAHRDYLARAGTPRQPADLLQHRLIGFDRDDSMQRGFAALGLPVTREHFALRTDEPGRLRPAVASGAGIGFVARTTWRTGRAWCRCCRC
jgi:DNA-binding transcriptional LysR family regulator